MDETVLKADVLPLTKGKKGKKSLVRIDRPVKVGEYTTWEPHPEKDWAILIRSRQKPTLFVQVDTMKGVKLALRLLAMAERSR